MKSKENRYKQCTDEIYSLFTSFKMSGFDTNQAMDLTSAYLHQSIFDDIISNSIRKQRRLDENQKAIFREYANRNKESENPEVIENT